MSNFINSVRHSKFGILMASDDNFKKILEKLNEGSIYIYGNVGVDKTVLASMLSHMAVKEGSKSLYISFKHNKEEFYMLMKKYGIDLMEAEVKGLFNFIKIPLTLARDDIINILSRLFSEYVLMQKYSSITFDSITALLNSFDDVREVRALLHNFIGDLSKTPKYQVVLVCDEFEEGLLEFNPDFLIEMRSKVFDNLVFRELRIIGYNENSLTTSYIPYVLNEGSGFHIFLPPEPNEFTPLACSDKQFKNPCSALQDKVGNICPGDLLYIELPSLSYLGYPLTYIIIAGIYNSLRTSIIGLLPRYYLESELFKVSRRVLMSRKAPIFMKKIFDKYVRMETLTSFTASELINKVLKTLAEFKPDIIVLPVFNESHSKTSSSSDEHYGQVLLNVVSYLKSLGLVTILVSEEAYSNSFGKVLELYADVSIKSLPMRRLFRLLILKFTVGGRRIEHQKNLGLRNFISCSRELKTLFRDVLLEDAIQLSSP